MIDHAGPPPSARHRWGRHTLPAVIIALLAIGVTALILGVRDARTTPQPPLSVAAAAPDSTIAPPPGNGRQLTTGPLMATSPPTRVVIPALDVDVPLIGLDLLPGGTMQVPADAKTVGWYTRAPTPGALGPAVLAGHVDYKKQPGTFAHLSKLAAGNAISIHRQDGSVATFAVTAVERYAKNRFPTNAVYGPINHAGLRLITCGGPFDTSTGHYEDNIVVYATLTAAHPA